MKATILAGLVFVGASAAFAQPRTVTSTTRPSAAASVTATAVDDGRTCSAACEPAERFVFQTKDEADEFVKAMEPRKCKLSSGCAH